MNDPSRVLSFRREGLTFDVTDVGPLDGRVVIALHGFPEDRACWTGLQGPLAEAGYRVLAPDQRGYSPGARPRRRREYIAAKLRDDVLALADTAQTDRFDVIGHDWGGFVAWDLAARRADRVRSCISLSTPHPLAMRDVALKSTEILHLWYIATFQLPWLPELSFKLLGRRGGAWMLQRGGLDPANAARYAAHFPHPRETTGPINWYRALPSSFRDPVPDVTTVPSLFVWGDADHYLTRPATLATAAHVSAPYRLEILPGAPHWLPTASADQVAPLVLKHLASVTSP